MDLAGKVAVVTGGAGGIGKAVARRMVQAGARVALADLDADRARAAGAEVGGHGFGCDVSREDEVRRLIADVRGDLGEIDLFLSNAGLGFGDPSHAASAPNEAWQTSWDVHVMAHVWAARALLPGMIARGDGYLINTASAAGLLNQIGDAAYSVTKHAAVGLAEALAISHGRHGVKVSVICPQYVATPMLGFDDPAARPDVPGLIGPDDVAATVMAGIAEERFLILPHPVVGDFWQRKTAETERWIRGMQKLRAKAIEDLGSTHPADMYRLV